MARFPLRFLFAAIVGLNLLSSAALACGAWDVLCEAKEIVQSPGAKLGQAGRNIEHEWNKSRTDLSNGLDRIDPRITQIGRDIDAARLKFQSEVFTGPALEQWIVASRNSAINGAMPMPPEVRQVLQYWYPQRLLDLVRFKIGEGGALNVANASLNYGEAEAITLIDVVIFRDQQSFLDLSTWVHEMKHIEQYDAWGVHSFAVQYMRSWNSVEDPAYAVQRQFTESWKQVAVAQSAPQMMTPATHPNVAQFKCYLSPDPRNFCWMNPGVQAAYGSPCTCQTAAGFWNGLVGY